ncbi:MAG: hypothetical protein Q8R55_00400 [Candidatus Taylorbacteria bacterium]|nr:hypothetical protein [Candidatus Taylorbacteria bacterium]
MDIYELHKKINIVLGEEIRAYEAKGRIRGALGSMNIGLQSVPNNGWTTEGEIPQLLFDKSDPAVISSPNATTLLKLYSSLDADGKNNFKSYLITNLRKDSQYASISYFNFFVLYRIGETIAALNFAREALSGDSVHGYSNVLGALSMIVSREYLEIDQNTYERIKIVLLGDKEHNFQLIEKINLALLKHLERDLSDVNPEINTDRDKVLEIWGAKFSDIEVPSMVREIEDYFREGEFTETKFATCIGRIRILLVETSKRIALDLAKKHSDSSIQENSDEHHFFQYLKNKQFISDEEWNILRSLYGLSSDKGAHSTISNREYARLIKNMTYDMVILFLSKYKL